jgi:metal-sulfur cluster biosynthetic enzyme
MGPTLAAEWHVDEPQLRVTEGDARAALRAVTGQPVIPARARLRFVRRPAPADPVAPVPAAEPSGNAAAVRDALADVIDPDLGVNIVDLGFVRGVAVEGRTAVITMTLTSAACPLTGVLEDQIRAGLTPLGCVDDFRVGWQWIPAWRPADITEDGREQLRAIGFTI